MRVCLVDLPLRLSRHDTDVYAVGGLATWLGVPGGPAVEIYGGFRLVGTCVVHTVTLSGILTHHPVTIRGRPGWVYPSDDETLVYALGDAR